MVWMLDPHADRILRGLHKEQDRNRWKTWLRYAAVVVFAGIVAGATFLKLRPPSVPIAPIATEAATAPAMTTFPSLLVADLPQAGWPNPEVKKTVYGKTFEGGAGDIFVIKAGEIHSFKAIGDGPLVQVDLHLSPRFIQENLGW